MAHDMDIVFLRIRRVFLLLVGVISTASPLHAQYIEQWNPGDRYRYLPRLPEGNENPPPLPRDAQEPTGSEEVLVKELKAVVIIDHEDQIQADRGDLRGVHFDGTLYLPGHDELTNLIESYLGAEVSLFRLNSMSRDIVLLYRDYDMPVVDVSVPEQDITDGVVHVIIREARIGNVIVQGPCYFDPCVLQNQLWLCPGGPIYESVLLEEQRWLMRNPFRDIDLELTPGSFPGETDIVFNVHDRPPRRIYAGYEDTGNQTTGLERTVYGFNWYNAFGKDDQLGYQFTTSSDFATLKVHSAVYSKALYNRDILTVFGSYAEVDTEIAGGLFNNSGKSWQVSARWFRELCPCWNCWEPNIQLGFDWKNTNNNLDFGGVNVFASDADIAQFMVGYHAKRFDSNGSARIGVDAYFSPGGIGGKNNNANFQTVRAGADANYWYGRAYVERRSWVTCNLELVARVTGQWADTNLLPPETLGLGGYNSVRGYDMFSYAADLGYFTNLELWTAPICICGDDELRLLTFYDFGDGYTHSTVAGIANHADLASAGAGLRYTVDDCIQVRADYGWQIHSLPGTTQPNSRFHIGAIVSY